MRKIIYSDELPLSMLEQVGTLFTLIDSDHMIKQAASSAISEKLMREHKPDKDHFAVHAIALGADEFYGPNRNGDGWPEKMLVRDHPTFVSHGHFFREHRNTDPKLKIGDVKAAAYNDAMHRVELIIHGHKKLAEEEYEMVKAGKELSFSMSCFPAGTPVRMADGTEKPIEAILSGEKVLTHRGNIGVVSHTMRRAFSGEAVELRAYGLPDAIRCTPDHGIWARRKATHIKTCPVCGTTHDSLMSHLWQKKDPQHQAAYKNLSKHAEGFTAAANLLPGDYVRQAVDQRVENAGHADWATVAGYYLAEGSISAIDCYSTVGNKKYGPYTNWRTEFSFNISEDAYIAELCDAVERLGFKRPSVFSYPACNRKVVRSHSKELYNWLETHCGKYSSQKKLSQELMHWSPFSQKIILEKWIEGDGSWHKKNEVLGATTVSRILAIQMLDIAARCGYAASLGAYQPKKKNHRRQYFLKLCSRGAEQLSSLKKPENWKVRGCVVHPVGHLKHQQSGQTAVYVAAKNMSYVENGFVYRRLRKVARVYLDGPVYDLTVPVDHGFMVNGYGVSNCRVPFDQCSCCENKATKSAFYCKHLREHMLQYLPQFRKFAYAVNPKGTFFDISKVKNRADRIAAFLQYNLGEEELAKAASAARFIFSDEWAEHEGVLIPDDSEKGLTGPEAKAMLEKLASAEAYIEQALQGKVPNDARYQFFKEAVQRAFRPETITPEEFKKLAEVSPDQVFDGLAHRGATLPFVPFAAYALGMGLEEATNDIVVKSAQQYLPRIFRTLQVLPISAEREQLFESITAKRASCYADPVDELLNKVSQGMTVMGSPTKQRIISITITSGSVLPPLPYRVKFAERLTSDQDRKAKSLAQLYGMYKVSACLAMELDVNKKYLVDESTSLLINYQHLI